VLLFVQPHQTPVAAPAEAPGPLFAHNAALWDRWHRLIIQENGRLKPFASFCRESVQTITGEDGFEGTDATAVVVSWILLHEADPGQPGNLAKELGYDWESNPFILCDYQPLRALLYRPVGAAPPGRHVAPALLRDSVPLTELLWSATQKGEQEKKALYTPL